MADRKQVFSCPIGGTLEVIAGRWKSEILWHLGDGPMRFNALQRKVGQVSQKMLSQQLRELQRDGLVTRKQFEEIPPRVEYSLTEFSKTLQPLFKMMVDWSAEHSPEVTETRAKYDRALS